MSHPLIELANEREVKQSAAFRLAAVNLNGENLLPRYEQEKANAPRLHESGRKYFIKRSGKPPSELKKGREDEHLASALVRHCLESRSGLALPDEGSLDLLDHWIRVKAVPISDPATKGIGRMDLLGLGPDDQLAVVKLRFIAPESTRCGVGDTPLRSLLEGLAYVAIAAANQSELREEIAERFGRNVSDAPPRLVMLATPRYWQLCRKREAQKGAAWIKEMERLATEVEENLGVKVAYRGLELEGNPGWHYDEGGAQLTGAARIRPAWETTAGRVRPKPKPRPKASAPIDVVVEPDLTRPVRRYQLFETYEPGDRIDHPKLGLGVVQGTSGPGKIRVRFDERLSLLVHERGAPAL